MVLIVRVQFARDYAFGSQDKVKGLSGGETFKVHGMLDDNGAFGFGFIVDD